MLQDTYKSLTNKTRLFFRTIYEAYPALEFVVKVDDDVYLLPPRLLMAADQWAAAKAE